MRTFFIIGVMMLSLHAQAEDWKVDGKTYEEITVVKVEDDAVTILYKDGGALVPLAKLPPPLQRKYSYDPDKAKIAADARAKADAANAKALQAEINQADELKQQRIRAEAKTNSTSAKK